jgi:hypothetical protein
MDANTSTCTDTRLAFDLAEAIPSTSLDSHQHLAPWKERLSSSRWLRRRSTAVTAFSVIRCREDWKDILVKTSSAARQQLADLAHPKVSEVISCVSIFKMLSVTFRCESCKQEESIDIEVLQQKLTTEVLLPSISNMGVGSRDPLTITLLELNMDELLCRAPELAITTLQREELTS